MCGGSRGRGVRRTYPKMEKAAAFLSGSIMWAQLVCVQRGAALVKRLVSSPEGWRRRDRRMPARAHTCSLEPRERVGSNVGRISTFPERTPCAVPVGRGRNAQTQTADGTQSVKFDSQGYDVSVLQYSTALDESPKMNAKM